MRLIDADALIEHIEKVYDGYNLDDVVEHWKDLVNKQPTVDLWHYPSKGEYPTERDWYLGVFEEADTGFRLVPVVCDYLGKQTKATTKEGWIINKCTDVNDTDPLEYYVNLKCVAWMPLPEPPKEEA